MAQSAIRTRISRGIGILVVLGTAFGLLVLIFFGLGYGGGLFVLLTCIDLFILLMLGIGTILAQYPARLALSMLLPLQACWLVIYVILKTPRPGQICDFSCYVAPQEVIALPVVLSLLAAWVVYPGRFRPAES
ncbi:MAG TPA: hypothetical protein VGH91_04920 [Gammaproteobacteria bacterium]|jgi:hypothetical protein